MIQSSGSYGLLRLYRGSELYVNRVLIVYFYQAPLDRTYILLANGEELLVEHTIDEVKQWLGV